MQNREIQKVKKEEPRNSTCLLNLSKVMMANLDALQGEGRRPKLDGELEEIQIEKESCQTT